MCIKQFLMLVSLCLLLTACGGDDYSKEIPINPTGIADLSGYQLASGDQITITVFGEESLSGNYRLSDAGTVSYPLLGELQASGLTIGELEKLIATRLVEGKYLVTPKVTVSSMEYRKFFINGEVKTPGGYAFSPGLTILKAASLAGGFTERASRRKIYILREGNKPIQAELHTYIQPGDIITVEESFF
ncbi:polysaccharide biosynthesis/export family protein [Beggiatoa leptomitoformis]|uniref:Polysaccharide export protein n=1 Tax=Beggiatoa leptomitoformis TaxID=288004 RepID=A0A2N9YIL6_9GAMM|nr:polysaccharide biosynthesis/export family protein [Beggiatoa leptomitoformis]ALG67527.1 polysaccharide export protein [Beggiatoa leptomitoformis]AUI70249.1 polysaccharide export protein [Beggiatoa leptomitoformis]